MMTRIRTFFYTLPALVAPHLAFAQVPPTDFRGVVDLVLKFLQWITALAWMLLFMSFVYTVIKFLLNFDDERAREEGKRSMVFSLVATAAVFMVWGIISFLTRSVFGLGGFGIPVLTPPTNP
jgi:heme/copper-type cytochrome/quinol oxidase subunit 2